MPEENFTLIQAFEWHCPPDTKHWRRLTDVLPEWKAIGINNVWFPPACKAAGGTNSNGYDIYDLYDVGEFDQKGGKPTKWGSKEELLALCEKAKEYGMKMIFDAVLNHKAGADYEETCRAQEVEGHNRLQDIGEPFDLKAWLRFTFPGRGDQYSKMKWNWMHFSGTDYDAGNNRMGVYRILGDGKRWSTSVSDAWGNGDFLMYADIDYAQPDTQADIINWAIWVVKELGLGGFRFDACQHFSERFTNDLVAALEKEFGMDALFLVGEYWSPSVHGLLQYLDDMHHHYCLFDAPLVYNFSRISCCERGDLRHVFDNTLVQMRPSNAVTVVMNHDTQPGQAIDTKVEGFFKPLAYCLILLRKDGYPSVFYGDLYGIKGPHPEPPACSDKLADMILARKLYAYGSQEDYWDHPHCIGFVRRGTPEHPAGLACVMSNAENNQIRMAVGWEHKGEVWTDVLGWKTDEVKIEDDGFGLFPCHGCSVSIWVKKDASGRERFGKFNSDIYSRA